jgi:hypothetical protein
MTSTFTGQLILGTDRRNPLFTVYGQAEGEQEPLHVYYGLELLARMLHKPVEQMGGRGVRKLENSELYDNQLRRPEPNRL